MSSTRARSPSSSASCCRRSIRSCPHPRCASCCSKAATGCCRRSSRGCRGTRGASSSGAVSTVRLTPLVASATDKVVRTKDGREIETASMIWTAGVKPSELAADAPGPHTRRAHRGRRLPAGARCRRCVRDRRRCGRADKHGRELPMTSPPAMQEGRYVAKQILGRAQRPFRYFDKGTLATIGRTVRRRRDRTAALHRFPRLARVARRAPLLPDRFREPVPRDGALVLVLRPLRPSGAGDHPAHPPRSE